jgi:hypothetical protein
MLMAEPPFPPETMRHIAQWATRFAIDWRMEHPIKVHSNGIAKDGTLEWHPDFAHWMSRERRPRQGSDDHYKTSRAMKRLWRNSPRAYDVCYRVLLHGEPIAETTKWLNDRAARNDIPFPEHRPEGPHYTERDTFALLISGIDYVKAVWGT